MAVAVRVRPQVPNAVQLTVLECDCQFGPNYFKLGVDISYSDAIIYT